MRGTWCRTKRLRWKQQAAGTLPATGAVLQQLWEYVVGCGEIQGRVWRDVPIVAPDAVNEIDYDDEDDEG